jgi:hypothetical protein
MLSTKLLKITPAKEVFPLKYGLHSTPPLHSYTFITVWGSMLLIRCFNVANIANVTPLQIIAL